MSKLIASLFASSVLAFSATATAQQMDPMPNDKSMDMGKMQMAEPATRSAQGIGIVKAVDRKAGTVTIAHEPIAALKWPAMTMKFKVEKPASLEQVARGKKVQFTIEEKERLPVLTAIKVVK